MLFLFEGQSDRIQALLRRVRGIVRERPGALVHVFRARPAPRTRIRVKRGRSACPDSRARGLSARATLQVSFKSGEVSVRANMREPLVVAKIGKELKKHGPCLVFPCPSPRKPGSVKGFAKPSRGAGARSMPMLHNSQDPVQVAAPPRHLKINNQIRNSDVWPNDSRATTLDNPGWQSGNILQTVSAQLVCRLRPRHRAPNAIDMGYGNARPLSKPNGQTRLAHTPGPQNDDTFRRRHGPCGSMVRCLAQLTPLRCTHF